MIGRGIKKKKKKSNGERERKSDAHLCPRSCQRDFSHGGNSWWSNSIDDCETDVGTPRSLDSHPWPRPSALLDFLWPTCVAFSSRSRTLWDPCEGRLETLAKNCSALLPSRFPWEEKSTKSVRLISPRSEQIPRVLVCCSMKRKREKKKKNNNRARLFPPPLLPTPPH